MRNIINARQFVVWIRDYFNRKYKTEFFKYRNNYLDNVVVLYMNNVKDKDVTISFLITENNKLNIIIKNHNKEYHTLIDKKDEKHISHIDLDTANIILENKKYIKYCVNTILDYFNYYKDKESEIS